ncbi:MAG: hypothetical protein ACE37F_15495 [Nannocystaceae bacterium]|nr:hypothetical protein [bacterium]
MKTMRPRHLLASLALLCSACSLPEQVATAEGPAFTLTAQEPVAAFEVTLCLSGPNPQHLDVRGHLEANVRTHAPDLELLIESLDRPEVDEGEFDDHARTYALDPGEDNRGFLRMLADGDFRGSGERCGEPEVIEFSVDLPPGATVDVDTWHATMTVQWDDGAFGDGPRDGDLRVEISRL